MSLEIFSGGFSGHELNQALRCHDLGPASLLVWSFQAIMADRTSEVTFSHDMYKFGCTDKFHLFTFSFNCVLKDLG